MLYITLDLGRDGLIYGHCDTSQNVRNSKAIKGKTAEEVLRKIADNIEKERNNNVNIPT